MRRASEMRVFGWSEGGASLMLRARTRLESSDERIWRRLVEILWELVERLESGASAGRMERAVNRGKWSEGKGSSDLCIQVLC